MTKINIDHLKQNYQMIHFFGLGFVQLKIDNNLRYHFYHPELTSIVQEEEVHNHRYNFISTILAGSLINTTYDFNINPEGKYIIEKESCNIDEKIENSPFDIIGVDLIEEMTTTYNKGDTYTCLKSDYHKVNTDFAITRLYRGSIDSKYANIIRKKGAIKICPFSKQLSIEDCWDIVKDSIKIMNS